MEGQLKSGWTVKPPHGVSPLLWDTPRTRLMGRREGGTRAVPLSGFTADPTADSTCPVLGITAPLSPWGLARTERPMHGTPAPHTHAQLRSGPAVSEMLKQVKSLSHQLEKGTQVEGGSWKRLPGLNTKQPPTLNQNLLLSTWFKCPVKQRQLQLPLRLRWQKGYGTAHTTFPPSTFNIQTKTVCKFKKWLKRQWTAKRSYLIKKKTR